MSEPTASAAPSANGPARPHLSGEWWRRLRANPSVALLVAGAAVVAILVGLLLWATAPPYRVLYSNLSDADGGRIISALEQRGIPYEIASGGSAVLVPADRVHRLRLQLAEEGLPKSGPAGFEILDQQPFGISQFAEQVNFQRALEGELAQTIAALGPVQSARVHLVLARPSVFVRDDQPAEASVVVTLRPGRTLGQEQADAIAHLVSSSVPRLAFEDVSIIDDRGRLLSRNAPAGTLDARRLEYIREIERTYRERIEDILIPLVGRENVRAQVTAEIDLTRREQTTEEYAPNQGEHPATVRSAQTTTNVVSDDDWAGGVPGALSNLPPGAAASPISTTDLGEGAQEQPIDDAGHRRSEHDQIINYEVDRSITHTEFPQGQIRRLSVAVAVNYREQPDENSVVTLVPRPPAEMANIRRLVEQAMGYSAARGDRLEVVNSRFTQPNRSQDAEWWESAAVHGLILTALRYLVVLAAAILLYRWFVRPFVRSRRTLDSYAHAPTSSEGPATGDLRNAAPEAESGDESPHSDAERQARRRRRLQTAAAYEDNLRDLREIASRRPDTVATIIQKWMRTHA